jgi:hypothetical protein
VAFAGCAAFFVLVYFTVASLLAPHVEQLQELEMRRRKYKGQTCVYCVDAVSTEPDHVFARQFFLEADRRNLPQVPTCRNCNSAKSQLELYLTALLPFGGRHSAAKANLEMVRKRLANNLKLHKELAGNWGKAWFEEAGIYVPTKTLPVDENRMAELFSLIVRGLVWHHWKTYLTRDHFVKVLALTDAGERVFDESLFSLNAAKQIECSLGNDTVKYEGRQGKDLPEITAWRITMYGGLKFADPQHPGVASSLIGAITGPKSALHDSTPIQVSTGKN